MRRTIKVLPLALALAATSTGAALADSGVDGDVAKKVFVSRVGDADNFGYGKRTGAPPGCNFFDHREPDDDMGVFDYEPIDVDEDRADAWRHRFDLEGRTPTMLELTIWAVAVDPDTPASVQVDHLVLELDQGDTRFCSETVVGGYQHVFRIEGELARQIAADGEVWVYLLENGDDLPVDRARMKVTAR